MSFPIRWPPVLAKVVLIGRASFWNQGKVYSDIGYVVFRTLYAVMMIVVRQARLGTLSVNPSESFRYSTFVILFVICIRTNFSTPQAVGGSHLYFKNHQLQRELIRLDDAITKMNRALARLDAEIVLGAQQLQRLERNIAAARELHLDEVCDEQTEEDAASFRRK